MLLTEEQANAKWCPQARIARRELVRVREYSEPDAVVGGCNRDALGGRDQPPFPNSCRCIASACALWVKIEPGKGVMGCNPVMAEWAAERLLRTRTECVVKPLHVNLPAGAEVTRTEVEDAAHMEIKVPPVTGPVMTGDDRAAYVVGRKLAVMRIETEHPIPDEVVVRSGMDIQVYVKAEEDAKP